VPSILRSSVVPVPTACPDTSPCSASPPLRRCPDDCTPGLDWFEAVLAAPEAPFQALLVRERGALGTTQRHGTTLVRDAAGRVVGFILVVALPEADLHNLEMEAGAGAVRKHPRGAAPAAPCPSPDERGFVTAVRDALRDLTSPDLLRRNPLTRSRLVAERAGGTAGIEARVGALQALVREVVGSLGASPRRAKLQRALHYTYLEPAASQERAAELLDLPFSTYRHHLKVGLELVGEILWQRETGEVSCQGLGTSAPPSHLAVVPRRA
jgi:hypothetical protein